MDPTSPMSQEQMMEEIDNPDIIDNTINLDQDELFNNFIENHQGSSSNTSSLNVVESQDSLQVKKGYKINKINKSFLIIRTDSKNLKTIQ